MTNELNNPYGGRTLYRARPAAGHAEFRLLTPEALALAQEQWDAAEKARVERTESEDARYRLVTRDEINEEPSSKALENRLRVAFLSTKGATVKDWLEQRDAIMSDHSSAAREA
jgi:hypothetical protein